MNKDLILKKGDIVTYKRKEDNKIITTAIDSYEGKSVKFFEAYDKVLKVERSIKYKTIYELKEILDEKEKEYLSRVIEPFRDNVKGVTKYSSFVNCVEYKEWIVIEIRSGEEIIF